LLFACNQFGKIAPAAIEGVHEQADSGGVAVFASGGVLFEKLVKAVYVARVQELERTLCGCHKFIQLLCTGQID
jgi:hypothetical protein